MVNVKCSNYFKVYIPKYRFIRKNTNHFMKNQLINYKYNTNI